MGVDAEMFARIRGKANWLSPEKELATAYALASTIGSDNFLITKGGRLEWSQHHALEIMRPFADAECAADYGLPESAGGRVVWSQDGEPIYADEDEQFVRVHLYTRYYGEEYARGNWPIIRAVAEWLEQHLPGCEVWYGGDSSGICAEPLSAARRDELNRFYLGSGRKTYTSYFTSFSGRRPPVCPCCEVPVQNCGGGQGEDFWFCDGCGRQAVTSRSAAQHWGTRHDDIFKLAADARAKWAEQGETA